MQPRDAPSASPGAEPGTHSVSFSRIPCIVGYGAAILAVMAVANQADLDRWTQRYSTVLPAALAVERAALGSDYGANGFTTVAQADQLAASVHVGPGDLLLDVGAGCGWPGLRIAALTGCSAVVSDLTLTGMRRALVRAHGDGMAGRVQAMVASAQMLPFRPESFDAMVHSDVLC